MSEAAERASSPRAIARKDAFIDFLLSAGALRFGHFVGKSGREMPYFIDAGRLRRGSHVVALGQFYADCIQETFGSGFDVLFGPAYKGISLVVAAAQELHRRGQDCGFTFNRKEAKDHGEGGLLVGEPLVDGTRVVLLEDVTTAGTSIRELMPVLQRIAKIEVVGLVVGVDRQERGHTSQGALEELSTEFGFRAASIVTLDDIISFLKRKRGANIPDFDADLEDRIQRYRARYGAPV